MIDALEQVRRHVEAYAATCDEPWRSAHVEATDCLNVECEVETAVHLYALLRKTAAIVETAIRSKTVREDPELLESCARSFQQWLERSDRLFVKVEACERSGFHVASANALQTARDAVRRQCFDIPGTAAALAQVNDRKTVPLNRLADGLRSQNHGKSA